MTEDHDRRRQTGQAPIPEPRQSMMQAPTFRRPSARPSATTAISARLSFAAVTLAAAMLAGPAARPLAAQQAPQPPAPKAEFIGPNASGTLSQSVRVGGTVYLSGMLGTVDGALVAGGIAGQTKQALTNMAGALERAGATMDDVVQCTVFLADMAEWPAMNTVYIPFFPKHRPARTAVAVNGMALDARVEIQCVAVIGAGSGQ